LVEFPRTVCTAPFIVVAAVTAAVLFKKVRRDTDTGFLLGNFGQILFK
jgi:hypothetical protein